MSASELVYSIRLDKSVLSSLFVAVAVGVVKPSSVPLVNVNVLRESVPKVVVVAAASSKVTATLNKYRALVDLFLLMLTTISPVASPLNE